MTASTRRPLLGDMKDHHMGPVLAHSRHDDVQRDQMREGQRMAREEHPLRRSTDRPSRSKKPEVKGHEAFLKALEVSGREQGTQIQVEKMNGDIVVGTVKCSDHFTITVRVIENQGGTGEHAIDRVLFKHDISEFRALGGKKREDVDA